ncbi:MAG: hypothetical protein ACRYG8_05290 [Janthinobacterium lividum]
MADIEVEYHHLRIRSGELLHLLAILKHDSEVCASLERPKGKPTDAQAEAIAVAIESVVKAADVMHEAIRNAEIAVRR